MRPLNRSMLVTIGICLLLGCGATSAWGNEYFYGDMNCDGELDFGDINAFVLALTDPAGYEQQYPDCDRNLADINGDDQVDFGDVNAFVALLANPAPYVWQYWNSGCLKGTLGVWCDPDEIVLSVVGHTLHVLHLNPAYNCCLDDIVFHLEIEGDIIKLTEEEVLTNPCYCICCYNVGATVVNLPSGTYTVIFCWFEYDTHQIECYEEEIKIP